MPVDEIPDLKIYFTSRENSNGIISLLWYFRDHYKEEISSNQMLQSSAELLKVLPFTVVKDPF